MPEGPELFLSSKFVNSISSKCLFTGKVTKSEVSWKNPDIPWDCEDYVIVAQSRGKEMKLTLKEVLNASDENYDFQKLKYGETVDIIFHFGMSGKFAYTTETEMDKHAHLHFRVKGPGNFVLSFVDTRRFGRWAIQDAWGGDRGPCVIQEPHEFRNHILENLQDVAFNRPICEVMLNQKYFNGIGNYLRAEILYRLDCPPFECARKVLETLTDSNIKCEKPDILDLCHTVPIEVTELGCTKYFRDISNDGTEETMDAFEKWLQCYDVAEMNSMVDHNKRTIWFKGKAGPMAPSAHKNVKRKAKVKKENSDTKPKKESGPTKPKVKKEENDQSESEDFELKPRVDKLTRGSKMKIKIEILEQEEKSKYSQKPKNSPIKPKVKVETNSRRSGRLQARTKQQAKN